MDQNNFINSESPCCYVALTKFWFNLGRRSRLKNFNLTVMAVVVDSGSNQGALAIRRIFSLVDMFTKPKFSNCPNVFKIGLFG